jgi:hypothetical protein
MKPFVIMFALMSFYLTSSVYATCPGLDTIRFGLGITKSKLANPNAAMPRINKFFLQNSDISEGDSFIKNFFMMGMQDWAGKKIYNFKFASDFDDVLKSQEVKDLALNVQEYAIDNRTDYCSYYRKVEQSDILFLSFTRSIGYGDVGFKF